jgi:putative hydrolase of the HAD superfamily
MGGLTEMFPAALLFDLDGTLHDRAETIRGFLVGHLTRYPAPPAYAERFITLDDLGYRAKRLVFPQLISEFALTHDPQALLDDFSDHAWDAPAAMPHAAAVLAELRARGTRLGIITNGWTVKQLACLDGLRGVLGTFDEVLVSEAVGLRKPDPAIFRLGLARLGVTAVQAWYVGDSPQNDVLGPQSAGLRAALLPGGHPLPEGVRPDAALRDLRDVLTLPA